MFNANLHHQIRKVTNRISPFLQVRNRVTSKKQITSGFSWNTITVVLQVVIQLAYTGLLARLVSPDSFTLMGIVLGIMGFAEIFSQVGVGPALVQRKEINQQHINGAFYTAIILGLLFTLAFVAFAPLMASLWNLPQLEKIIQVVCTSFFISALAVVPRSMMMRAMRFKVMFFASMISIIGGNVIVGLLLAYNGWNVWAYVWALFAQNALMTIALWLFQPVKITRKWEWSYTRELVRYGAGSTLFNALNYFATKLDVMIVPLFAQKIPDTTTDQQLFKSAMYERSNYVMSQPITIMGKLSDSVLFSGMSRMQDEDQKLRKMMLIATNLLAIAIVPVTVFVCFFSKELLLVWLGPQYEEATPVLSILFIAVIWRSLSKLGDSLLRAKDAVYRGSWYKAINVLLVALGIYLAIPYGMPAAAGAVVVSTFINYLMNMHLCTRLIGIKWVDLLKALIPSMILAFATMSMCFVIRFLVRTDNSSSLIVLLISGLYVFGTIVLAVYYRPEQLGDKNINPLYFLPERIQNLKFVKPMMARLKKNMA